MMSKPSSLQSLPSAMLCSIHHVKVNIGIRAMKFPQRGRKSGGCDFLCEADAYDTAHIGSPQTRKSFIA
jgi:hypothetical protein